MLFDTYGFPIELQEEYASEAGITIDKTGFYELLELQRKEVENHVIIKDSMQSQEKLPRL